MTDFLREGQSLQYTPPSVAVTAGDVLLIGAKICVAKHDIAILADGTLACQGTFKFPKTAATVYAIGVAVYWDVADQEATEDADTGTNKLIGYVQKAAASADALVECYLVNNIG